MTIVQYAIKTPRGYFSPKRKFTGLEKARLYPSRGMASDIASRGIGSSAEWKAMQDEIEIVPIALSQYTPDDIRPGDVVEYRHPTNPEFNTVGNAVQINEDTIKLRVHVRALRLVQREHCHKVLISETRTPCEY